MKRPAFQFYPSDWLNDLSLRQCSPMARCLWMDMICLMHEGEPYGHLRTSAGDVTNSFLSRISGLTLKQVSDSLGQLKSFTVYSITESGTIYSRRMVRDESIREARAQGGQKSILNPNVPRSKKIPLDEDERMVERISLPVSFVPSPSSSSSSSSSLNTPPTPKNGAGEMEQFEFRLKVVATEIHDRHPSVRRDLGIKGIADRLRKICNKAGLGKIGLLDKINRSHLEHCNSAQWQEIGDESGKGQFAKGLENWLGGK